MCYVRAPLGVLGSSPHLTPTVWHVFLFERASLHVLQKWLIYESKEKGVETQSNNLTSPAVSTCVRGYEDAQMIHK